MKPDGFSAHAATSGRLRAAFRSPARPEGGQADGTAAPSPRVGERGTRAAGDEGLLTERRAVPGAFEHQHAASHSHVSGLTISAIIPTFRRFPYMLSTVEQLLGQTRVPDEIIVVDQTPLEEIAPEERARLESLCEAHPRIRYVRQEEAFVYKARNLAAAVASTDILLYLDDDIEFSSDLTERHLENFENPGLAAVAGGVTSPGVAFSDDPLPAGFSRLPAGEQGYVFTGRGNRSYRVERVPYSPAGNFAIRRRVLMEMGGWDERIVHRGDVEMGIRLHKAGHRVDYDPCPRIVHFACPAGGSRDTDVSIPMPRWRRAVGWHYLALRHLRRRAFVRFGLWRAARFTILLKRNFVRPWKWPAELFAFFKGLVVARRWIRQGPMLPFASSDSVAYVSGAQTARESTE